MPDERVLQRVQLGVLAVFAVFAGPGARPSTVVTAEPSTATARARHALARRPSISTVQAPHWP